MVERILNFTENGRVRRALCHNWRALACPRKPASPDPALSAPTACQPFPRGARLPSPIHSPAHWPPFCRFAALPPSPAPSLLKPLRRARFRR